MINTDRNPLASSSPAPLASITAIAQTIQEKANALTAERDLLQDLQQKFQDLAQEQECQAATNHRLKYKLLKQIRKRHGVELEQMQREDCIQDIISMIQMWKAELGILHQDLESVQKEFQYDLQIQTPHIVKIELFQRRIEGELNQHREKRQKREHELNDLISERHQNLQQAKETQNEQEQIEAEIASMERNEVGEDEEIAALAMQIRATLSKRASLRGANEKARERNQKANEKMMMLEEECLMLSSQRVS